MYESQWLGYKRTWEARESLTRKPAESKHNKFHSVNQIMYGSGPCRETALQSYPHQSHRKERAPGARAKNHVMTPRNATKPERNWFDTSSGRGPASPAVWYRSQRSQEISSATLAATYFQTPMRPLDPPRRSAKTICGRLRELFLFTFSILPTPLIPNKTRSASSFSFKRRLGGITVMQRLDPLYLCG